MSSPPDGGTLFAVSDLHIGHQENRRVVERLRPESEQDWLIVAGDVSERFEEIEWALRTLRERFATVVWAPGNHELWTPPDDPVQLRGDHRYRALVELCRRIDVLTPEDPYPVWRGAGGPVVIAPLFLLYDYTFRPRGTATKAEALAAAHAAGVVCTDEMLLHPDPFPDRESWCAARVAQTERRLAQCDPELSTVLVNHFPLRREPTLILRHPEFALWCGTERTDDWHLRHRAAAVVYGHLHIPRTSWADGVRFLEVSLGYPREWASRGGPSGLRPVFPRQRTGQG
ncbi:metallophosphoesterase [Kitasatospora sp. MBT63]|uniref:metallophosphoesterase family protein n=1 Tax=Kitasatospora sp. MBT63 TaxID=1444768 RepID=UPI00053B9FDD|nr:metallophosphoesterase [Kitasatospora sp. MBT63]